MTICATQRSNQNLAKYYLRCLTIDLVCSEGKIIILYIINTFCRSPYSNNILFQQVVLKVHENTISKIYLLNIRGSIFKDLSQNIYDMRRYYRILGSKKRQYWKWKETNIISIVGIFVFSMNDFFIPLNMKYLALNN